MRELAILGIVLQIVFFSILVILQVCKITK